ncbi:unnamed protein product [Rotaria magnacalcarata]|uniref:Bardet-Biedl syndrome 2 protein homolog n=1 Tax=Rotaria magnacalcarata TaxID=392030 RepID=A0A816YIU1_9BILA|nr:unnamed protein product [Rotaria magnacalcarata]
MLIPIFSLQLNNKVFPRTFAVGKFDGKKPSLIGATAGNKVFIHSPHDINPQAQQLDGSVSFLNVNQVITSLACGQLDEQLEKDLLVVGTNTHIIAYDMERNVDLFFQEIQDGANAITIGSWGELPETLAIVGGNCSIHGFNKKCEDILWTVTGDNVSALSLLDFNSDGYNELVVGSEDYDIRVFREDQLIADMQESEIVVSICPLINGKFAYALSNGTIGVYERSNRQWRIKSRNMAIVLETFDIDGDGVEELVTGWSNGKVDIRNDRSGEVIFKDSLAASVAGIVKADYRIAGENSLICCTNEGEVRGYKFSVQDENLAVAHTFKSNQEAVRDLLQKKQTLLLEIQNIENVGKAHKELDDQFGTIEVLTEIPASTEIQTGLAVEKAGNDLPGHVAIKIKTTNGTIIRAVTIFAEGLFRGECYVVYVIILTNCSLSINLLFSHPATHQLQENVTVPIVLPRDAAVDLHLQIFVGLKTSKLFHIFDLTRPLPIFSMYTIIENSSQNEPKGYVTFSINERISRIVLWINHHFLLAEECAADPASLYVTFLCVRTDAKLVIRMQNTGHVRIQTDDIELAGNIIQSMGKFLKIENLHTNGDFPLEFELLQQVFSQIEEYQAARQRISSDMAEHASIIRSFLIRAEDARLMGDIPIMKQHYIDLLHLNRDLINGYTIRCTSHEELMRHLRFLNQMVQKAGNLRLGKYKTNTINHCRVAIKGNNVELLIKSIRSGTV